MNIIFISTEFQDRKYKAKAKPLKDNKRDHKYIYELFVYTGLAPNSGTKSKVR